MSVRAFTNANGTHYNQVILDDYDEGWTIYRPPYHDPKPLSFQHNYAKKDYPYKPGRAFNAPGFRLPSSYSRTSRNVLDNTPRIREINGFDGSKQTSYVKYVRHLGGLVELGETTAGFNESLDNARRQSNVEARLKLKDNRMQLGVELAEAKLTLHMLAETSSQLARAYLAAKRGAWNQIPAVLGMRKRDVISGKAVANRWLQYQYGWKPLMGTAYSLGKELTGRSTFSNILSASRTVSVKRSSSKLQGSFIRERSEEKGTATTRYWARTSSSFWSGVDRAGLINPLSIAWELSPFSFVADWFVPIGSILESMTGTMGLEFIAGYQSTRAELFRTWTDENPDPFITQKGSMSSEFFRFYRGALNGFQLPQLYANENPFSSVHIANAAALIRQMWR